MVPFKPYFLGQETPPYPRAVSVQKCVRTPDIEDVGKTTRHGTFFEMCGNFSFGDYFKEGAIELAWELVTKPRADGGYGLEESRLYPSVYADDEALELWKKVTGLPDERILRLGQEGELLVDGRARPGRPVLGDPLRPRPRVRPGLRPDRSARTCPPSSRTAPGDLEPGLHAGRAQRGPRPRPTSTSRGPLPKKNIDTGMGLERVAFLLQGKRQHVRDRRDVPGHREGRGADRPAATAPTTSDDVRFRVVADHVRSSMMLIGDGVTPGNEARGYVLRRLLRRAVRSMRLLGYEDPALPELMPVSRDKMARDLLRAAAATGSGSRAWRTPRRTRSARRCAPARRSSTSPRRRRRAAARPAVRRARRSRCTTPTASRST